jgi:putative ABC transport system permease protein
VLAEKLETGVGQTLRIESDIYPGTWEFKVVGIYKPMRKTVDRLSLIMRWDMLNEKATWSKDTYLKFEQKDDQTLTMSERQFQLAFLGTFAAVLKVLKYVSWIILLIMALILSNTISMSVRERTNEYGVLRAIGFQPSHVRMFIAGESILIGFVGGLIGVGLVFLLVNQGMGPFVEREMASLFVEFRAPSWLLLVSLGLATAIGSAASLIPSVRAGGMKITDQLRRID